MNFFDQLQRATAGDRAHVYDAPLIRAAFAGQVTRADYRAFLGQAYHHVRHTVPLLMACGARLGGEHEWLRGRVAHYIAEELGHQDWVLADIRAAGGDVDAVRDGCPHPQTELLVAYAYDTIQRRNPVGFLGMVYVLESTSTQLASGAAATLQTALGLPAEAFTYLTSHGALDVGHMGFFQELVDRLDAQTDRDALLHGAHMFFRLYGDLLRSIEPGSHCA